MTNSTIATGPSATVHEVRDLALALAEALAGADGELVVDLAELAEADLSLVQLLLATDREARQTGKTLRVIADGGGVVGELCRGAGLVDPAWLEDGSAADG